VTGVVIDLDLVRRLAALPEVYVLDCFWLMVRHTDERLWVLHQFAAVVLPRPGDWDYAGVRREHEASGSYWRFRGVDESKCFSCECYRRVYRHHIIEVQHGGSNAGKNQVPLCFACHQQIHPWLESEPPAKRSFGFESIRSIAPRGLEAIGGRNRDAS